jgi:tRNA threonylcarbamoyladenosine biosynthesis protein TsaE
MMVKSKIIYKLDQLSQVAQKLAEQLNNKAIITLTGDLGAGKTTLVKKLLNYWGVQDAILSPTFTYVNCYKNDQGQKIFHFDLYRISSLDQFLELGFDEYLHEPNSICLIEWPQIIRPVLENLENKSNSVVFHLEIRHISDDARQLIIQQIV